AKEEVKEVVQEKQEVAEVQAPVVETKQKKEKPKKEYEFPNKMKDYLTGKEIEVLAEIASKNKELTAKVRIDTPLGKQEFYLVAKDKKKITEDELIVALQRASTEKMPALFMAKGE